MEDQWVSVAVAAELRGVSVASIRNSLTDGRIKWRWGTHEARTRFGLARRRRVEVFMPSVFGCKFPGSGNGAKTPSTGPVTDETWARFEAVYAQLGRGEVWPAMQGEHDGSMTALGRSVSRAER